MAIKINNQSQIIDLNGFRICANEPSTKQNGDIWISGSNIIIHSNDSDHDLSNLFNVVAKTAAYTVKNGEFVIANVEDTASFDVTLDSSPNAGDKIGVSLGTKTTAGRKVTIKPNGNDINGSSDDIILTIQGWSITLIYDGSQWLIISDNRFEKIAETIVSSSTASVSFADDWSVFNEIVLKVSGYQAATNASDLLLQFSNDLGSTWENTSYAYGVRYDGISSGGNLGSASSSSISILRSVSNTITGTSCIVYIPDPSNSSDYTKAGGFTNRYGSTSAIQGDDFFGHRAVAETVNGIKIEPSSGNISKAKIVLLGIR